MYFKIYHKRSKQLLQTFNEQTIINFCTKNRESLSTFYFLVENNKSFLEWEAFATQYDYLFVKKRDEQLETSTDEEILEMVTEVSSEKRKIPWVLLLSLLIVSAVYFSHYYGWLFPEPAQKLSIQTPATPRARGMEKRKPQPSDSAFVTKMPTTIELKKSWKQGNNPKIKEMNLPVIKSVMNTMLPNIKECFDTRISADDSGLRGTMNMRVRVSGDGVVRDVLFPDKKYQSTLFGDCVISALKQRKFPSFKANEQVFTYYFSL